MPLDLELARSLLERRDRAFMARDIDAYVALWREDARVEGPEHSIGGVVDLRRSLERAWKGWEPLYMGVVSIGVAGWIVHHEFVSVWERRGQTIRRLVSGVGVAEADGQGRFVWLREYFDPSGTLRESVLTRPEIVALEPEGGFDTG